jgi:hypothetical protein
MAAGGHFGSPKLISDNILVISDQDTIFNLFFKMANGGHFGCPKFIFGNISRHFRSSHNFHFFFKMANSGHFGCPKFIFGNFSRHFRSKHNFQKQQQEQPKTLEYAKMMARTKEISKTLVTTGLNLEAELQIKNIVSEKSGISKETDSQI